ncbi:MAG: deaminase [Planctomycetota bacterium]|nr:deaminase [Planctomycetota bacterium]
MIDREDISGDTTPTTQEGVPANRLAYGQNPEHERPDWQEYFLKVMETVATRANCDRGRAAAVIVKDKRIIATGYVGAPAGLPTCDEIGHLIKIAYDERGGQHKHCVRTTHAEANAIAQAAKHGTAIDGADIYIRMTPCLDCTKLLINAGIKRVICRKRYHADHDSVKMLAEAGVELTVLSQEHETYDQMN